MSQHSQMKPAPKGKGMMAKAVGVLALLGVGGGGAFGLMQAGIVGGHAQAQEDRQPKLIRKGEKDPYAPKPKSGEESAVQPVYGLGGSEYRTAYYTFDGEFVSNLKGSDALIQVHLAASTRRDGRVLMWMKEHELAIRSALLTVLADTTEEEITSVEGKKRLQERLTTAVNEVLVEEEGFGGVDDTFFRSFIVQ